MTTVMQNQTSNFMFDEDDYEYSNDEVSKKHPSGIMVSDHGRVMDGTRKTFGSDGGWTPTYSGKRVCHMVLETFVSPRPSTFYSADHIDQNSYNNRRDNLPWFTPSEQAR
jgi:hypothetical protein